MKSKVLALAVGLAGLLSSAAFVHAADYKVAYLAASSQNGFNQAIWAGVQKAAKARGVEVEIFNGEFDATKQYSQIEDIVAGGKFQAIVITPNDSVGIATAVDEAIKAGVKVATTLFPIGPKLDVLEPQVPGLTTTVASNPAIGAKAQADAVIDFCKDKTPCKVAIIIGQKIYPFDNLRYETYLKALGEHKNIEIVATVEGNYDPDKAMTGMQDVLQAHKDINVVLSNADQHLVGAEIALQDAGIDVKSLYLIGGGANQIAIDAIKAGRWDATLAQLPQSEGEYALNGVVDALEGKATPAYTDEMTLGTVPPIITKQVLDAHPDYKPEWQG
ncbi:sugar ABC transporter substrate-binding protein [Kaistia dalseonensis]|uniref:Ribose transport system substrate-binding protein n=1 Tax=Kaistia dalseonensis TaxID=410840 RepID=A0ABU0HFD3_9HYPH|nr:sugar ABC transporter substrate-binding protein [Kaistia dalseonensis]MCX5497796.1 sugar ABC transporter substrate-binding protein [Kaistia dalseonensis]MDQ0440440.1 ribose transport system substrate-binding protein [Kaistia dalseonensis]